MRVSVIALLVLCASHASNGDLLSVLPAGKADGKQFNFKVTDVEVRNTPVWRPDAGNPPLSPRRAGQIAEKQLQKFVADRTKWRLHEIGLVDFGHDHWAYVVRFERQYPPDLAVFGGDFFEIPVLMSGATLKPEVRYIGPDKIERIR